MVKLLVALALVAACNNDGPWFVSTAYGEALLNEAQSSTRLPKRTLEAVDVVQIFRADDEIFRLNLLRHRDVVFETRDPARIKALFDSLEKSSDGGCDSKGGHTFHLIAYDAKLLRAAYMRIYVCARNGQLVATIRPLGDSGTLDTITFPAFLVANGAKLD